MNNQPIGIYHVADNDGLACAAIFLKKFPEGVLIPWNYHYDPLKPLSETIEGFESEEHLFDFCSDQIVYMMDVSLDYENMCLMNHVAEEFHFIDHHYDICQQILADEQFTNNFVNLSGDIAACELTWNYLFPGVAPTVIELIGDYDVHRTYKDMNNTALRLKARNQLKEQWNDVILTVQTYVETVMKEPHELLHLLDSSSWDRFGNDIVVNGFSMLERETYLYNRIAKTAFTGFIDKEKSMQSFRAEPGIVADFFVLNAQGSPSKLAQAIWNQLGKSYFVFQYFQVADGYKVSLRAHPQSNTDVSKIAKQHGGGGHKKAAGFFVTDLKQIEIWINQ